MSRLLVLTSGVEQAAAVAEHLKLAGAAVAELSDAVLTAVVPSTAGSTIVNCGVAGPWVERMATFGDTVGVAMLANDEVDPATALAPAMEVVRRIPLGLPVAIGVRAPVGRGFTDWVAGSLERDLGEIPIFTVDTRRRTDVSVLLAALLCLAYETAERA
jgi:hypothetical protein